MKVNVVKIDETRDWRDDIAAYGPIYSVYCYNPGEVTHLCELTPSYYLYFLYYTSDSPLDIPPEIDEAIQEAEGYAEGIYVHCNQISKTLQADDFEDMGEAIGYYKCNWPV